VISKPIVATVIETHIEVDTATIEAYNQMIIIQVQVGKNIVEDVLLDGRISVNIITENLITKIGLPKPRPTPYHLRMAYQNMTKPLGFIKNLKIHIHGIPCVATFIVLQNIVVDFCYSMLLRRNAKVTHEWGNNVIIVQGNGIIRTISANKKLGAKTKRPRILVCYDLLEGLINEEEDLIFDTELKLFSIGTITILEETILLLSIRVSDIKINEESKP
jgi:hypothetical protein